MRKSLTLSAAIATAIACSSLAFAGGAFAHEGHQRRGAEMGFHAYNKLNLTDTQRASIKQMVKQSFDQAKPQMQALRQKRETLQAINPGAPGYQAAVADLAQAEASAASARVTRQAALRAQIYGALTTPQRAQLATMRAQREARHAQWQQFKAQHPLPDNGTSAQ